MRPDSKKKETGGKGAIHLIQFSERKRGIKGRGTMGKNRKALKDGVGKLGGGWTVGRGKQPGLSTRFGGERNTKQKKRMVKEGTTSYRQFYVKQKG